MNDQVKVKLENTEKLVLNYLDQALALKLELSEDEGQYHLEYITKKLIECARAMEKLSDIQLELTKITLEVTKLSTTTYLLLRVDQARWQGTKEYQEVHPSQRGQWLFTKNEVRERDAEYLTALSRTVSEVRNAVGERLQTFKRLDSDVRLHQKLFEARLESNAAGRVAYRGKPDRDVEL